MDSTATPPRTATYRIDESEIRRAADVGLFPDVFELRVINAVVRGDRRPGTFSGYYRADAVDCLIRDLRTIERAPAVYFTPNPVKPALLGRALNRARIVRDREPTTSDKDIAERRWLLIDVDAERPAGVSATDEEKAATLRLAHDIDCELWEQGFPPGIIGDSGNGTHLMIPTRLPTDDGGFHERLLKSLAAEFDNEAATVDVVTHNPARIWKLPGTAVCKGDDAPELGRVHRMSKILTVCKEAPRC